MDHAANDQDRAASHEDLVRHCQDLGPSEARAELEAMGVRGDPEAVARQLERLATESGSPARPRALLMHEELDRHLVSMGLDPARVAAGASRLRRRLLRQALPSRIFANALTDAELDEELLEQGFDLVEVEAEARRVRRSVLREGLPASVFALRLSQSELDEELEESGLDVARVEAEARRMQTRVAALALAEPAAAASLTEEEALEWLRRMGVAPNVERSVRRVAESARVQAAAREAAAAAERLTRPEPEDTEWSELGSRLLEVAGRHARFAAESVGERFVAVRDAAQNLGVELTSPKRSLRRARKRLQSLLAELDEGPKAEQRRRGLFPRRRERLFAPEESAEIPEPVREWLQDLAFAAARVRTLLERHGSVAVNPSEQASLRLSVAFHKLEQDAGEEERDLDEEAREEDAAKLRRFEEERRQRDERGEPL
ncbi:MAG: hypothetical protein N2109_02420 [Fimbriimonadales bacterium]|nr:hypothetical protein [Fimbriimonadales bacterium]